MTAPVELAMQEIAKALNWAEISDFEVIRIASSETDQWRAYAVRVNTDRRRSVTFYKSDDGSVRLCAREFRDGAEIFCTRVVEGKLARAT